jgi:hypothetical protein
LYKLYGKVLSAAAALCWMTKSFFKRKKTAEQEEGEK